MPNDVVTLVPTKKRVSWSVSGLMGYESNSYEFNSYELISYGLMSWCKGLSAWGVLGGFARLRV
jgi:hypothetical protein